MSALIPKRTNPRRRTLLRLEAGRNDRERVLNLSVNGMFVAGATVADARRGALWIPGESRPVELAFRHVYRRADGVGVHFDPADRRSRGELLAYVNHQHEQRRLQAIEAQLLGAPANLKPIGEADGTRDVLRPMERTGEPLRLYADGGSVGLRARIAAVDEANARLTVLLHELGARIGEFDPVFLALPRGGATYLADTVVERRSGSVATLMLPERLFLPERRRVEREAVRPIPLRFAHDGRAREGEVVQLDANGCLAVLDDADARGLVVGTRIDGAVLADEAARALQPLRVAWLTQADGRTVLGLERLFERAPLVVAETTFPSADRTRVQGAWARLEYVWGATLGQVGLGDKPAVEPWVMADDQGRPLVHLVNRTFDLDRPPPEVSVVLIPPPYGRTKEMPSILALTLVETFRAAGLPLLVLRWDGTNHVGESWRDDASAAREHAMLHYTQTQAVADLALTVRRLRERLPGTRLRTAVVSFSLASVATRRYLAAGGPGVDAWIAPMGAADARDTIRNGNGGVDLVGMKKRGERLGIRLIQGHIVDADRHCADLVAGGFADLDEARRDMAAIAQPVTWICGLYDYWVNARRVEDILSVPAPGSRELVRVPTGHFVRTSHEALATFRLIAERAAAALTGRAVPGRTPSPWLMERTHALERARLVEHPFDAVGYWREYLLGNRENPFGFDLLALTDEYTELMGVQVERLGLKPGERLVDLGCGTGNALAAVVRAHGDDAARLTIDAVDLVPEVLDRARRNLRAAAADSGVTPPEVRYHAADLSLQDVPNLPFAAGSVDAVLMSLVLPYLADPGPLLDEVARVLKPGGRLVVSSLRPDVDMSGPVARLREKLERGDTRLVEGWTAARLGSALRDYLNRAATLLEFEVDGRFQFHEREALEARVRRHGLRVLSVEGAFGEPPLALVLVAQKDV